MEFSTTVGRLSRSLRPVLACAATDGAGRCPCDRDGECDCGAEGAHGGAGGAGGGGVVTLAVDERGRLAVAGGAGAVTALARPDADVRSNGPERLAVSAAGLSEALASLPAAARVSVSTGGDHAGLVIRRLGTPERQVVSRRPDRVALPASVTAARRGFEIPREGLIEAAAVSDATWCGAKPRYRRWMLRVRPGGWRSAGGCGVRFLVREREGPGAAAAADGPQDLLIAAEHTPAVVAALKGSDADVVRAAEHEGVLSLSFGDTVVLVLRQEPTGGWVDELRFLDRTPAYRLVTRVADWGPPLRGITAEPTEDAAGHWLTEMEFDLRRRRLWMHAVPAGGAVRGLKIGHAVWDEGLPASVRFTCATWFLRGLHRWAGRIPGGYVQLELDRDARLLALRYDAGKTVQADPWRRDAASGTRDRRALLLANCGGSSSGGG